VTERRLGEVLTSRFSRVAWTVLAGYALLVIGLFALTAEALLRRSVEHSADVIESLLSAYADSAGAQSVAPAALVDQLLGMGSQVVITRTTTNAGGMPMVYYLSPGMPAKRLEGLPPAATREDVSRLMLGEIARGGQWRYRVLHRAEGAFDIYVAASRGPSVVALGGLAVAALALLPLAAIIARRGARQAAEHALLPLERVTAATRAFGPEALGTRVASPTGQAEVTELAESINRMLERVDRSHRALESFTGDASHELRTPLAHVRAEVQWASEQGRSPEEVREALTAIEQQLDRMTKMVEELLLLARGENRKLALARAPFDLEPVVREVEEITEAMAAGHALTIHPASAAGAWAIGDPDRTRHVLLNLASNAVRYTASGTITFGIERNRAMVGVSVRDTGAGIAHEHLNRIFDRFYRVDQSRSRALGGAGLGLTIARLLAELQGGYLGVESAEGRGSTFTVWLPAADRNRTSD